MDGTTSGWVFEVAIVGAGFGGMGMAMALGRAGMHEVVILERGANLGGVWRDNAYPGAACDIPAHLYSFSFAPQPDWPHAFATREDIYAYLRLRHARRHLRLPAPAPRVSGWRLRTAVRTAPTARTEACTKARVAPGQARR